MLALACPASLKGVLAASAAAAALGEGLRAGGAQVRELPVADGGEGDRTTALGKAPGEVARRSVAAGVRCVVFGGIVDELLPGVETVALSGDPARAENDLRELGRTLAQA